MKEVIEIIHAGKRVIQALVDGEEIFVDRDTIDKRMRICSTCPFNRRGRCTKCGCYLHLKRTLTTEGCPMGFWNKTDENTKTED